MAEIYRRFAKDYPQADLSDEAALGGRLARLPNTEGMTWDE